MMPRGKIRKRTFRGNDIIFDKCRPGNCAYMVMQSRIGIYKNLHNKAPRQLAILYKGYIFGEMALFDDSILAALPK
jgi:CRP-like cAMP-binding protein